MRYYDPVLGRFISPDAIVAGADTLTMGLDSGRRRASQSAEPQSLHVRYHITTVAVGGYLLADAASDTPDAPDAGSGIDAGSTPLKAGDVGSYGELKAHGRIAIPPQANVPFAQ